MTADTMGGVWTYALDLVRALTEHEVRVALATMGAPLSPQQWAQARAISHLEVYESRFKLEWMDDPWREVRAAGEWLLNLEQTLAPDVIHLNGYAHGALAWQAPVLVVGHSCVLSWWQAVYGEPAPANWARYADHVATGLRRADLVVAPTQAMLDAARRHYGPLRATRAIANASSRAVSRKAQREPFVLCAGRLWDDGKNVATLAAIAPRLSWPVRIAGADRAPDGSVSSYAIPHNVTLLGELDAEALAGWQARASIYASPALYEPFGLSVLEAARAGCALVLGDIESLRENWDGAALFVAPRNSEALAATLQRLIGDELLKTVARRMLDKLRPEDSLFRLGGDEFVVLLTGPRRRGEQLSARLESIRKAIAAGKHIYTEKPTAESFEDALDLARAARDAGVKNGVVHDKLYLPGLQKLKRLIDSGFFGRILSVRGEFGYWVFEGDWQVAQRPSWNYRSEDGGGIVSDMFAHWNYVIENLFGPIRSVYARAVTHIPERVDERGERYAATADDAAYAIFELEDGAIVQLNSSWAVRVHRKELVEFQVDGTLGSAVVGRLLGTGS